MAATWCVLYFARETEHIEGRKSACALKLRSHTGHVSSFWTAGFHESNGYLGWWSSPAFFWFQLIQSWRVLYRFESPWALLCPCAITFCVRGLASGRPRAGLGAPRMPTNLLHHGPKNRAEKSAQNMAAIERPRQYEEGFPRGTGRPSMKNCRQWEPNGKVVLKSSPSPHSHCQPVLRFKKQDDQECAMSGHVSEKFRFQLADTRHFVI